MRCINPITIKNPAKRPDFFYNTVPCGKCGACKFNRRVDWSFRIKEEFRNSLNGKFITLTYDEQNVPIGDDCFSLRKRDLQLFIKKLRKKNSSKVRYYAVGEYGSETLRPHYHVLVFNVDPALLDSFDTIWNLGFTYVGDISDASIHYVTKFHVNYEKEQFDGKEPEFVTMSRRPGIGNNYVDRVGRYHNRTQINYVRNNGYKQRMPRYYKDKIFNEWEKKRIRYYNEKEIQKLYEREKERLKVLGYDDPDSEMELRNYLSSLNVEKKSKENGKI